MTKLTYFDLLSTQCIEDSIRLSVNLLFLYPPAPIFNLRFSSSQSPWIFLLPLGRCVCLSVHSLLDVSSSVEGQVMVYLQTTAF